MKSEKGFTLVELLVGLVIGLLLAVAVADFFTKSNRSYLLNESRSQVQERGRFAINVLARETRSSMSWGCLGRQQDAVASHLKGGFLTDTLVQTRVFKSDPTSGATTELPSAVYTRAAEGTLILKVAGFNDYGLRVEEQSQDSPEFTVANTRQAEFLEINQGDYLLVIDAQCTQGHLVQASKGIQINGDNTFSIEYASSVSLQPGNKDEKLSTNYAETFADFGDNSDYAGRINLLRVSYYFLSEFEGRSYLKVYRPSQDQVIRLVPGVREMLVRAGSGNAGAIDGYLDGNNDISWETLRSIRLDLLIESEEDSAPGQKVRQFLGGKEHSFKNQHAEIFSIVTGIRAMNQ